MTTSHKFRRVFRNRKANALLIDAQIEVLNRFRVNGQLILDWIRIRDFDWKINIFDGDHRIFEKFYNEIMADRVH